MQDDEKNSSKDETVWLKLRKKWRDFFEYNHDLIEEEPSFYAATQGADREEQYVYLWKVFGFRLILLMCRFIVKDRATSYSSAQRSLIVMQILLRAKFDDTDKVSIYVVFYENVIFGACIFNLFTSLIAYSIVTPIGCIIFYLFTEPRRYVDIMKKTLYQ